MCIRDRVIVFPYNRKNYFDRIRKTLIRWFYQCVPVSMIDPHDSGSKFLNIFQPEEHISDNRISEYGYLTIQVFLFADSGRKPSRRTDLNPVRMHTDFYRCRDIPHSMDQSIGYCFPEGFFRDFVNTFPFRCV